MRKNDVLTNLGFEGNEENVDIWFLGGDGRYSTEVIDVSGADGFVHLSLYCTRLSASDAENGETHILSVQDRIEDRVWSQLQGDPMPDWVLEILNLA